MSKKKPYHRESFQTKDDLRCDLESTRSILFNVRSRLSATRQELAVAVTELQQARAKIINDGFLLDELRKQVAHQHMLLSARREDARAAGARWAQPRKPAPVDPALAAAIEQANGD